MKIMCTIAVVLVGLYAGVLGLMYSFQRTLIYHTDTRIEPPVHYGLVDFTEHFVNTPDQENIQLWFHPPKDGYPTVVYFHGNAYTLGDRAAIYADLVKQGLGVLALSYRGYGKSTGSPTEQGLYIDARTAINFLSEIKHTPPARMILFGESLGTGVAVQMAMEFDVGGVILQSPYTSVANRAAEMYNYLPVHLLIKDQFSTIDKIANVKAPLLIFHGEKDPVIPPEHGRAVFAAAICPKEAIFFPGIGHNDFDTHAISEHVLDFAKKYNLVSP